MVVNPYLTDPDAWFLQDANLKKRAKRLLTSAYTTSVGWWKCCWQEAENADPQIENRIKDTQDNLGDEAEKLVVSEIEHVRASMRDGIANLIGTDLYEADLREGTTATDLVLKVVQMLRKHGVVNKFVEFYGEGLDRLPLADRATIANMAPEYGATCGFFGIDDKTLDYLRLTGREESQIALVEAYAKEQGFWIDPSVEPIFSSTHSWS